MTLHRAQMALLLGLLTLSGCSKRSEEGGSGSSDWPFHKPKYPPHAAAQPSVPPSTFNSGPAYDWEHPTDWPAHTGVSQWRNFANTRTFEETSAWIKKAMDEWVVSDNPSRSFSDFHFRGCIVEWHEEQVSPSHVNPTHVNEYNYSINLADANTSQIFANSSSFRLGWNPDNNPVLFRAWEKEEGGGWKSLGEQLQRDNSGEDFPVARKEMIERLTFAWLHVARLCGAKRAGN